MLKNPKAKINCENGCIQVSGALNFATVSDLWNESLAYLNKESELKFDFAGVTQANSAALALLLEWVKFAKQRGKSISFYQLPEQLQSIAKVSGVGGLFC
jgi:phospholipid transport system transporter-binding protein